MATDSSGLTPQQRHDIIHSKLGEYKKKEKVFHMRWTPGDLLDDKVLKSTPAFWYMRFGWSRQEIEGLFFAAKVYIDTIFERGLDQVFGTDGKGPRWVPAEMQEQKRGKWNRRQYYKTQPWWKVKQLGNINGKGPINKNYKDEPYAYDKQWRLKNQINESDDAAYGSKGRNNNNGNNGQNNGQNNGNWKNSQSMNGRRGSILNTKLAPNAEKIWQKASNYGKKNDRIDYKQFKDGLNGHNIDIDEDTAKKLFDLYADPKDGKMNFDQFKKLLEQLDNTTINKGVNIGDITFNDLGDNFNTKILMKRVLLAAAMDVPFNVTDFLSGNISGNIGSPGLLLGKLATRDSDWKTRLNIMENIANNLGSNPEYDEFLQPEHASDLIMGFTAQMLDTKAPVSKTAIEEMPNIFHEIGDKSHPDVAMSHLDDVIDGLFNVLDNKKHESNHESAKKALRDIVDDVVANQDAEAVLYMAGLLGEKTDIENCTDPDARAAALDNIKRIMMGDNAGPMDKNAMPQNPDPQKEWLDTGTGKKEGPSEKLMNQGNDNPNNDVRRYYPNGIPNDELIDDYNNNIKGKKGVRNQQSGNDNNGNPAQWGGKKEAYGQGPKGDRFGPNGNNDDDNDDNPNNNNNNINDNEVNAQYGGGDVYDKPESEYGNDPNNPNRKKGRENDVALKFGKGKDVPSDNNNNNNDDPNNNNNNNPNNNVSPNYVEKYDIADGSSLPNGDESFNDFDHIGFDGDANDRTKQVPRQKTNPIKDKRQKGKEKELALKFGRYGNRQPPGNDPSMHTNEVFDKSDPRYGSQKPKYMSGNPKNGTNNRNNDDNGSGNGPRAGIGGGNNGDDDDLDDSGNPNDPNNKGGKRGGTKRQGTNGKNDFSGKFGDDSKNNSPYGGNNIGNGDDQIRNKKGQYQQPKANDKTGNNNNNNNNGRNNNNNPNGSDEKTDSPMSSNEIGDEFRNVVSDAVSNALLDPNKKNKENGAKLADVMDDLSPNKFPDTLDGDAKKKYLNWKRGPMKPYVKQLPSPNKPLPGLKAGTAKTHTISGNQAVTIKPPTMPDI